MTPQHQPQQRERRVWQAMLASEESAARVWAMKHPEPKDRPTQMDTRLRFPFNRRTVADWWPLK